MDTTQPDHWQQHPVRIAIIVGSTRPARRARMVAEWALSEARRLAPPAAEFDLVDLADIDLPLLDEPAPAALGNYRGAHTRAWAEAIAGYDGFLFVTPEYNHSFPAALKNALDYLFVEWNDKAAGFVTYGLTGGVRAAEQLRLVLAELKVACVRSQVALNLFTDFQITDMAEPGKLVAAAHHEPVMERMLGELTDWSLALKALRELRGRD